jgi:hypothetical protein
VIEQPRHARDGCGRHDLAQISGMTRFRLVVHERQESDLCVCRHCLEQVKGTYAIAAVRRVWQAMCEEQDSKSHS